jgi:hypothetical protein
MILLASDGIVNFHIAIDVGTGAPLVVRAKCWLSMPIALCEAVCWWCECPTFSGDNSIHAPTKGLEGVGVRKSWCHCALYSLTRPNCLDRMICEDQRIGSTARFSDNSFSLFFSLCLLLPDRFLLPVLYRQLEWWWEGNEWTNEPQNVGRHAVHRQTVARCELSARHHVPLRYVTSFVTSLLPNFDLVWPFFRTHFLPLSPRSTVPSFPIIRPALTASTMHHLSPAEPNAAPVIITITSFALY